MFGLYHRLERNIIPKNSIHLFIDISPLFEGDGHLVDYVVLLEIVSLLKTNSLQTVSRQKPNSKDIFVFVTLVLALLFFVGRL